MNICFLDNSGVSFNSKDIYSNKIRGAENVLINLSREFKNLGHDVVIYNNFNGNEKIDDIYWINLKHIDNNKKFDLAITNNDIALLSKINSKKRIAISHSLQPLEKFIRKKQLFPYFKNKPKIVMMSKYHNKSRNFLTKLFGFFIIDWAVDEIFLNYNVNISKKLQNAIFTSNVDRNAKILIDIWIDYIFKDNKKDKLLITPFNKDLSKYNIFNRNFGTKNDLIKDLSNSRVILIPGHKAELFCIAAEEAKEMCIPIVTLGIGCLREKVQHTKTGFIANNYSQFAHYTNLLLNDNNLLLDMKKNLYKQKNKKNWSMIAKTFLTNAFE